MGITWKVYYYNNVLTYESKYVEMLDITVKENGFIRYLDGFELFAHEMCDSHYLLFSTKNPIDRIIDAEVIYDCNDIEKTNGSDGTRSNYLYNQKVTLSETENVTFAGDGLFAPTYEWRRIESVEDFIKNETLSSDETAIAAKYQWVFRFLETEYVLSPFANNYVKYTEVTNVSILRLHFVFDHKTYNLGVLDNISSGDHIPDNDVVGTYTEEIKEELGELWEKILQLVGIVFLIWLVVKILMSVCGAVLMKILGCIWELLKFVIKWVFRIVFFPLWLLFGGLKKKK